ncbi:hypothetical protein PGB90_002325 [Kerria lacca]
MEEMDGCRLLSRLACIYNSTSQKYIMDMLLSNPLLAAPPTAYTYPDFWKKVPFERVEKESRNINSITLKISKSKSFDYNYRDGLSEIVAEVSSLADKTTILKLKRIRCPDDEIWYCFPEDSQALNQHKSITDLAPIKSAMNSIKARGQFRSFNVTIRNLKKKGMQAGSSREGVVILDRREDVAVHHQVYQSINYTLQNSFIMKYIVPTKPQRQQPHTNSPKKRLSCQYSLRKQDGQLLINRNKTFRRVTALQESRTTQSEHYGCILSITDICLQPGNSHTRYLSIIKNVFLFYTWI